MNAPASVPSKFVAQRVERIDTSRCIVVLEEKHGTRYFDPKDWGGILNLSLHIFKERDKLGYYYPNQKPKAPDPVPDLPEGADPEVRAFHEKRLKRHRDALRAQKAELEGWGNFEAARKGDALAAFHILEDRKGAEYEDFDIEDLEMPKLAKK